MKNMENIVFINEKSVSLRFNNLKFNINKYNNE